MFLEDVFSSLFAACNSIRFYPHSRSKFLWRLPLFTNSSAACPLVSFSFGVAFCIRRLSFHNIPPSSFLFDAVQRIAMSSAFVTMFRTILCTILYRFGELKQLNVSFRELKSSKGRLCTNQSNPSLNT